MEQNYENLAKLLVGHSVSLKKGEKVLIDNTEVPDDMTVALVRAVRDAGGVPFVQTSQAKIGRELMKHATKEQMEISLKYSMPKIKEMDAYIAIHGSHNIYETSDIDADIKTMASKVTKPYLDYRVNETKWCILRWPTCAMAQQANLSTEAFEEFYFDVCTFDYSRFNPGMQNLQKRMQDADKVDIVGNDTDLHFSIKDINAIACGGTHNIPDGEVFSCPVKDSVNGHIQFNAPTLYRGINFDDVRLEFKDGKIVDATANKTKELNEILDSDDGARYIGEFAIGFNPYVLEPMRDILFDEKICGSFHFTPGQCYDDASNGNDSQVHWDMVQIQRTEYGGGEIYFDDELIRKDGEFIVSDLIPLNADQLLK